MPIPKLVVTAALMAAQVALNMSRKIEGPRLDELNVSTADYGTPIPRFWGIRRFECPIMWAEKLREKKKKSKTKGGKYAEYKYYGTWAVPIADHEIDAVTRIWMDRRLVYQQVAPGPMSFAYILGLTDHGVTPIIEGNLTDTKLRQGRNMRIYLGTDTQEPDPRMEAWCEDRYGPDTCPAYRGVSYIVFQDIPLEKFGNRIPQISVEAVSAKTDKFLFEDVPEMSATDSAYFSEDFSRLVVSIAGAGNLQIWDVPSRSLLYTGTGYGGAVGVNNDGSFYTRGSGDIRKVEESGHVTVIVPDPGVVCGGNVFKVAGGVFLDGAVTSTNACYVDNDLVVQLEVGFRAIHYFEDVDGHAWAVGGIYSGIGYGAGFGLARMPTEDSHIIAVATVGEAYGMDNGQGQFVIYQDGQLYLISKTDFSIVAGPVAASVDATDDSVIMRGVKPGAPSIWNALAEISTADLSTIRSYAAGDWVGASATTRNSIYDPINHAVWSDGVLDPVTIRFLDRVESAGVQLSDIVEDVAGWCGLTNVVASDLDQVVQGYSVTQGSGKDMIAPLLDIHDSIARPHDFSAQFIKRGGAPGDTIFTEDFVREGDETRYAVTIVQDTDLPRRISLNYADAGNDQQNNTVESRRPLEAVDAVREVSLDMTTYVSDPDEAQQLTDRYLRRQWVRAEGHSLVLTAQELRLEPGDTRNLELDGIIRTATCTKTTLSGGAIQTEWERDFPSLTTLGSGTGAPMDGRDPDEIIVFSPTRGFVFDIPLLADNDNTVNPLLYFGAGPYITGGSWPGAVVYRSDGDDEYTDWNGVDSSQGATWGYAKDVLDDADPWLWDRGNTVNIDVRGGTLSTVTEAEIDADPSVNMAYFGGEIINFTTATLEIDGTYTLSGFKRGRRGTEWATGTHAIGDEFVLASDLLHATIGLSEVGTTDVYKVAAVGRDPSGAGEIGFTVAGNSLRPYAPARVKWTTDGTDMFGEIIRRTRVGGAWVGGTTIPLSENSEEYEVDIMDGDDVLRTITATGGNTFTYTAAMISADGNVVGVPPDANVYQLSDAVGRGFALAA